MKFLFENKKILEGLRLQQYHLCPVLFGSQNRNAMRRECQHTTESPWKGEQTRHPGGLLALVHNLQKLLKKSRENHCMLSYQGSRVSRCVLPCIEHLCPGQDLHTLK